MADYFRQMFEALKETADGLIAANQGIKRAVDTALAAKDEHIDLRETVQRLESLIVDQGRELHALRDELRRRNGGST
jgi:hypothetical protein